MLTLTRFALLCRDSSQVSWLSITYSLIYVQIPNDLAMVFALMVTFSSITDIVFVCLFVLPTNTFKLKTQLN